MYLGTSSSGREELPRPRVSFSILCTRPGEAGEPRGFEGSAGARATPDAGARMAGARGRRHARTHGRVRAGVARVVPSRGGPPSCRRTSSLRTVYAASALRRVDRAAALTFEGG
jgi:hypothetical protein